MTCATCDRLDCELKGTDIEITKEKCEAIDCLLEGRTPTGWTVVGGEQ